MKKITITKLDLDAMLDLNIINFLSDEHKEKIQQIVFLAKLQLERIETMRWLIELSKIEVKELIITSEEFQADPGKYIKMANSHKIFVMNGDKQSMVLGASRPKFDSFDYPEYDEVKDYL